MTFDSRRRGDDSIYDGVVDRPDIAARSSTNLLTVETGLSTFEAPIRCNMYHTCHSFLAR